MKTKSYRNKLDWLQIWIDFKSGDRNSFELIYNEFIDRLFAYGSKMTDDHDLVRDSIQDLFIDLYNYSIDLKKPESLEFYLVKSLNRIIISNLKKNNRLAKMTDDGKYDFTLMFDFEEKYLQEETTKLREKSIQQILHNLEPQKRELLFLKFNTGLTNQQIADITGLKPETVKKQLYRLLSQIRQEHGPRLIDLFYFLVK